VSKPRVTTRQTHIKDYTAKLSTNTIVLHFFNIEFTQKVGMFTSVSNPSAHSASKIYDLMMLHYYQHLYTQLQYSLPSLLQQVNNSALITVSMSYQMRVVMDCQKSSLHQHFRLMLIKTVSTAEAGASNTEVLVKKLCWLELKFLKQKTEL